MRKSLSARRWAVAGLAALLALVIAPAAFAQTDVTTARISGVVRHADGTPLPGVVVEARNQNTGLLGTAPTAAAGPFQSINLPTGPDTVTATLSGFKPSVRENLRVEIGSAPTIEFRMQLATVTEAVTVTSEVPVVEVTNTAASTRIETEQLKNIPVTGRDFKNLVLLTPQTRFESERGNISVSGERGINTNVTVDGVDYNNPFF